mgnify:CR=1 FL=1
MSKKNKLFSWLGFGKDDNTADNAADSAAQQPASSDATDSSVPVQQNAEIAEVAATAEIDVTTPTDTVLVKPTAVVEAVATANTEAAKKPGFFSRLKQGLAKTSQNLGSGLAGLFSGRKIDAELYEELETQLLLADVGVDTTQKLIRQLEQHADRKSLKDSSLLFEKLTLAILGLIFFYIPNQLIDTNFIEFLYFSIKTCLC